MLPVLLTIMPEFSVRLHQFASAKSASAWFETRDDFRVSKTLVDKLKALSDPRLAVYAQLYGRKRYHLCGSRQWLVNSEANNQGFAKTSKPGTYFSDFRIACRF
jgi:hypothetical protein